MVSTEQISNRYIHLNHCGVQFLDDRDYCTVREKGRVDYHLLYIAQGRCYAEISRKRETVEAGSVILFKPNEKQKYEFYKSDRSISCYIHFSGTGCEDMLNEIGFKSKRILNIGKSKSVMAVFEKMELEANVKRPCYESFCEAYLIELIAMIGRRNSYTGNNVYLKNKTLIDAVCQLMYDEYAQDVPLKRYADFCHLSLSRFSHLFKTATNATPLEYITKLRIDKAKELLLAHNMTIAEIADKTGFSSQNYFSRAFKKHIGVSPKLYIKEEGL